MRPNTNALLSLVPPCEPGLHPDLIDQTLNMTAAAIFEHLDELGQGGTLGYAGRPVRITPAAMAREGGWSRNPLYTRHRELLAERSRPPQG